MIDLIAWPIDGWFRATVVWILAGACLATVASGRGPAQFNRETPKRWLKYGDLRTAALNGIILGSGVWTRVAVWTFYAMPLAAFAKGDPGYGARVMGLYGFTRLLSSWVLSPAKVRKLAIRHCTTTVSRVVRAIDPLACGLFFVSSASLAIWS